MGKGSFLTAPILTRCSYAACALILSWCLPVLVNSKDVTASGAFAHIAGEHWDHSLDLNEDFRILWTIIDQDIIFEVQARTLGYVGFGFSADGSLANADVAVGWVDKGHTYFQDRHVPGNGTVDPLVDPSQDYILIFGYENATHSVLRFRRKLDTCDSAHDTAITNDTMRMVYMYFDQDPLNGEVSSGSLPNPSEAWRSYRSSVLIQRSHPRMQHREHTHTMELRNVNVQLPFADDTLYWCKMFKLEEPHHKQHLFRYEPIFDSSFSLHYLQHITLYECQGTSSSLKEMAREEGRQCLGARSLPQACNTIVAAWKRGSEGFVFPLEAGYPFDPTQVRFYLMESHYNNLNRDFDQLQARKLIDNSGLRLYFTPVLRSHDAGVISIGVEPKWRHIIPPGQRYAISEGHCVEECTRNAFTSAGIQIFAVMMRTHRIGREIKLRQIRQTDELPPIAHDKNIDPDYQDFRHLPHTVRILPGDRLVAECIYDSSSRKAITLGGLTMKEESCTVLTMYYPRQKKLTTCHSLPSLPTVLHSLGVDQLATKSNPVVISSPAKLAGMTLEARLLSFDWGNQFYRFQLSMMQGSFKPLCWGVNNVTPNTEHLERYRVNVTRPFWAARHCKPKIQYVTKPFSELELPEFGDIRTNQVTEGFAQRTSRSFYIETLALSGATCSLVLTLPQIVLTYLITFILAASILKSYAQAHQSQP